MSARRVIVALLLLAYPKAWREEYGAEIADLLLARALNTAIVVNVLVSGAGERIRRSDVGVLCGLAMLAVITLALATTIAGVGGAVVLQASEMTLPTVVVQPFGSELYAIVLAGCGWWTVARRGGTVARAGVVAARVSMLAGVPVMVLGALIWLDVLELVLLSPDTVSPRTDTGLRYAFYSAELQPPSPLAIMVAPLFALPLSWLWGAVGGKLACWTPRIRELASR